MKKRRIHKGLTMVLMAAAMLCQTLTVYGAEGRIAFSDKSAAVGEEVSINMQVSTDGASLNSADVMLSYDPAALEFISGTDASGGAGSVRVKIGAEAANETSLKSALNFKAIRAGAAKITVSSQEVYDGDSQIVNINRLGDSTVTITAPAGASADASLSDLKVSPGTLTPEFSPEVTAYTAAVGTDVEKITVSATSGDGKANVVVSGNEGLQMGENQVVCTVTAEDGTTTNTYTIQVTKGEGGETGAAVTGVDVMTTEKKVTIIAPEEGVALPEGFAECNIKIDGQDVQGWVWASETEHKYCVFYGMNEAGEKDFYRYDLEEKTMQRYFQDPMAISDVSREQYVTVAEDYNALIKDYERSQIILMILAGVAVLLLIAVIVLLVKRNGKEDDYKRNLGSNREEQLRVRQKPERHISKEERYMRGLEAEEELLQTEGVLQEIQAKEPTMAPVSEKKPENLEQVEQELKKRLAKEAEKAEKKTVRTAVTAKAVAATAVEPEDDEDDFEFVDLS